MKDLEDLFAQIPQLAGRRPADFEITRLVGYTNNSWRLRSTDGDWILRVPRANTNRFIDRDAERHNHAIAVELGLAPEVRWDDGNGTTLTATLAEARDLRPADLADSKIRGRVVDALQRLHRSGRRFRGGVDLGALFGRFIAGMPAAQRAPFEPRLEQAEWVLGRLETADADAVPSHNDPVLENLQLDGDRIWLIDWEYSAPASPYWDLATLANAADFDYAQSRELLQEYSAGGAPLDESILFDYRGLLRLLADLWMASFARDDDDADP